MFGGSFGSLLKEGAKHFSGVDEAVIRNIEACKELAQVTRTSMGPNGMNKMVINSHDKLFVTNDTATIIKELDIIHPAAKMIVMASKQQEQEIGDGTNFVVAFAGELLLQAENLLRSGLHVQEITSGFKKASKKAIELLEGSDLEAARCTDPRDVKQVANFLKSSIASKQFGYEDVLAQLVAQACIQILPSNPSSFNVDNVRVTKLIGGGVLDTQVVKGIVHDRDAEGTIKHAKKAKIVVFAAGLDIAKPETKGTVVMETEKDLLDYSKGEEKQLEEIINQIAAVGATVIVSGGAISDLAMHFIERNKIMVIKVTSKFQLRRICKAVNATPLVRMGAPTPEELGYCDVVTVEEIGSSKVTILRQESDDSAVSTLLVRGSTQNILDDIERAIDDAVNTYKALTKDPRFVAGAGAVEIELAKKINSIGEATPGLEQFAIKKFAESLEVVPRTLAESAGLNSIDIISSLYAAHEKGSVHFGVDIEEGISDTVERGVFDLLQSKLWGIKFATDATITILKVDQIIMAKPAGGPKPPAQRAGDMDED